MVQTNLAHILNQKKPSPAEASISKVGFCISYLDSASLQHVCSWRLKSALKVATCDGAQSKDHARPHCICGRLQSSIWLASTQQPTWSKQLLAKQVAGSYHDLLGSLSIAAVSCASAGDQSRLLSKLLIIIKDCDHTQQPMPPNIHAN